MLGKAHLTIGMASAWTLTMPEALPAALPVIAGAAAGSLICDIDCESPAERRDASKYRILAGVITAAAIVMDIASHGVMWSTVAGSGSYVWCAGIAGFILTIAFASISGHRGFAHSLPALALETGFLYLALPQTAVPFAIAFITHLILDISNKKRVRLFYPAKKGVSLGLFYSDRMANRVCETAGTVWLIAAVWASFHH